ncbi:MAG: flagellar basal-body MS-ring/collar protein FliF [Succinivibrionaceae bacterium]|nr:flagellar basal-body MS-ring/collar protein FliF [Succinivibrionaceae bacterium]
MARNEVATKDTTDGLDMSSEDVSVVKPSPFGFLQNGEVLRSMIIILCLAIFLVVGIVLVYWGRDPIMRPLGSYSDANELNAVISYLKQYEYNFKFNEIQDGKKNVVSVPVEDYDKIVEGLIFNGVVSNQPKDGSDILLGDSSFGVSARKEEERLKYAREQQIADMLKNNRKIVDAKVLLAIPKRNVFVREEQKPSASVTLKIGGAGFLSSTEIDAVVDSVASSVHGLEPSRVTVIDQNGRLLNSGSMDEASQALRRATELQSQKEADVKHKIEEILNPILGFGNYTPLVAVSLDPINEETTSQKYNDRPQIRSEQVTEELAKGSKNSGVPGAVSNQPPANSQIPEEVAQNGQRGAVIGSDNERRSAVRNYELDTTISHQVKRSGGIERLSVSVAVNYKNVFDKETNTTKKVPVADEELQKITDLLAKGLGIDENRGDTLVVHSMQFYQEEFTPPEPVPFYETDAFEKFSRIGLSAFIILCIIVFIVRPMIMSLIKRKTPEEEKPDEDLDGNVALEGNDDLNLLIKNDDMADTLYNVKNGQIVLPDLHKDEDLLRAVRALVSNEPDLAAQVVKDWVLNNNEASK